MALLSRKQLIKATNLQSRQISIYILRKKLVEENGLFDPANEINKAFLQKFGGQRSVAKSKDKVKSTETDTEAVIPADKPKAKGKVRVIPEQGEIPYTDQPDKDGILPFDVAEKRLKHYSAIAKEQENQLKELELAKKKGELVPIAPIENIVFLYKQYIITQLGINYERWLGEIGQKTAMSGADMAYFRSLHKKSLNSAFKVADETFVNGLEQELSAFTAMNK